MGTGRLVAPPWWSTFLVLRPLQCIFWIAIFFVKNFQLRALALGRLPSLVGNCLGCVMAKTRSPSVPCITRLLLLAWGVRAALLWSSTSRTPYFHWSVDVDQSVFLLSVLHQYWEVWVLGIPQGLPKCCLLTRHFSRALGGIDGWFVLWDNSSNLLKS